MMALPEKSKAVCCVHEGDTREQELTLPTNLTALWCLVGMRGNLMQALSCRRWQRR